VPGKNPARKNHRPENPFWAARVWGQKTAAIPVGIFPNPKKKQPFKLREGKFGSKKDVRGEGRGGSEGEGWQQKKDRFATQILRKSQRAILGKSKLMLSISKEKKKKRNKEEKKILLLSGLLSTGRQPRPTIRKGGGEGKDNKKRRGRPRGNSPSKRAKASFGNENRGGWDRGHLKGDRRVRGSGVVGGKKGHGDHRKTGKVVEEKRPTKGGFATELGKPDKNQTESY